MRTRAGTPGLLRSVGAPYLNLGDGKLFELIQIK